MKHLFTAAERHFATVISRLIHCNHFLPERIELEKLALGDAFTPHQAAWNLDAYSGGEHPNIHRLSQQTEALLQKLQNKASSSHLSEISEDDAILCEGLATYALYRRYREQFIALLERPDRPLPKYTVSFYGDFAKDYRELLQPLGRSSISEADIAAGFALMFQVERAFYYIFHYLIGGSAAAARLRAAVWQSIFTHDMTRYRRGLYDRMHELSTLIIGPSGTGKELVARAIAWCSFIPFDPVKRRFVLDYRELFQPLNLSALAENLVESELFGHRKGAFTGAHEDQAGWLESCPPRGSLFLDEIGETSPAIQVKLLRVLQSRTLQRLGERKERRFEGKIIAATNRDPAQEMRAGRFREDFYYRLCSDVITTPSLHEQLKDAPESLPMLVGFIARGLCDPDEAAALTSKVVDWVQRELPGDYPWPGNFRELEQCVRNILVRGQYQPIDPSIKNASSDFTGAAAAGQLTAAELLERYCALVYGQTGSLEQTAKRLQIDRRTVRSKLGLAPGDQSLKQKRPE